MRLHAAIALSRLGDDRALPQIVAVATDRLGGYRSPRWAAAKRLAELGDPRGLEAMRDIYQHRDRIYQQRDTDIPARHAMTATLDGTATLGILRCSNGSRSTTSP